MRSLRTFVKASQPDKSNKKEQKHNSRHPKSLKILNHFDIATHSVKNI
jgi:hypothetical protein